VSVKRDNVVIRARVVVRGIVQGVGFRPFIHRLAHGYGLNGWVLNSTEGVVIEAEGLEASVQAFIRDITAKAPPLAVIERIESNLLPPVGYRSFIIESSQNSDVGFVLVSPDICTCQDCLREVFDPSDRRFLYPFTNCTNCGPRFTIIQDIPYDRPKTTMKAFAMCPSCEAEYHDPSNRRFHAQPNACPQCGPRVWLQASPLLHEGEIVAEQREAIAQARKLLAEGAILTIKGLGGFHLACDATRDEAVSRLRERKRRVDKPFALMSLDVESVSIYCHVDDHERQLLQSPQRPIVLLRRRADSPVSDSVAPRNSYLGVMLPYTPLHYLLLARTSQGNSLEEKSLLALVMTSGNLSEEPLAIGNGEALERLSPLADYFLLHDREIHVRCDDSVTRLYDGREMLIRRSRGYAPFPLRLRLENPLPTLACGAELKNTFCLARDNYAFLSQHIGDLQNFETLTSFESSIEHFENLFRVVPTLVACDMHPDYLSTKYAVDLVASAKGDRSLVAVQHHEAHVASCMAENEVYEPVIGVAFDGTGYGRDGNVWGGEFFAGDFRGFQRVAHLEYVAMPGGEAAIRAPYRMAFSHLYHAFGPKCTDRNIAFLSRLQPGEVALLSRQIQRGINAPLTSSCGRLFDAVSSLLGVRDRVNYEGQAAIELETLADRDVGDSYHWSYRPLEDGTLVIEAGSIIAAVVSDIERGTNPRVVAARFHNTLADVVGEVCGIIMARTGLTKVALSGGVFQNTLLLERALGQLRRRGLQPLLHHQVPPNDGGISLGQVMIANAVFEREGLTGVPGHTS